MISTSCSQYNDDDDDGGDDDDDDGDDDGGDDTDKSGLLGGLASDYYCGGVPVVLLHMKYTLLM